MPAVRRSDHLAMRKVSGFRPTLQMSKVRFHRTIEKIQLTKVLVSIKIFPSETTTDMNVLKDRVRKILDGKASIYKYEEEPVAFGLIALIAHVLVPEEVQDGWTRLRTCSSRLTESARFKYWSLVG